MPALRRAGAMLALALGSAAQADPGALLLQAGSAAQATPYEGVAVYRTSQATEVLRVSHDLVDGQPRDRFSTLTGTPREMVREGAQIACRREGVSVRTASAPGPANLPSLTTAALNDAAAHYELRDIGAGRIAGRSCRGVALAPRDSFRYGYEVCADEATAVPLKIVLLDSGGRSLESLTFTEVAFGAPARSPVTRAAPAPVAMTAPAEPALWSFGALPPGFTVATRARVPARAGSPEIEHVLLSDGLSAISVFATMAGTAAAAVGSSRLGAVNAYVRRLGGLHLTVMGEVPDATVRLIGEGLVLSGGAATAVSTR